MYSNSLKAIKIDRNILELGQIVCKGYNFNISVCKHIYFTSYTTIIKRTILSTTT